MKLERAHESLVPFFVILSALSLAIIAGSAAGSGQSSTVIGVIGLILVATFFLRVREQIWILIPSTWMLGGKVSLLPLPASLAQLCILFAFGTFLVLKAFKVIRLKPSIGIVEVWLLIVLGYLITVFVRNPVGVEALGSDRVGGKPYFDVVVATLACWVLSRSVASPAEAMWVPLLGVAGNAFVAWINSVAYRFPGLVGPISRLYGGIAAAENPDAYVPTDGSGRMSHFQGVGGALFTFCCARWATGSLLNPFFLGRTFVFLLSIWLVLMSGFRSALMGCFLIYLATTYFRRGIVDVVRVVIIFGTVLTLLIVMQGRVINLPFAAQRTLSFLPGQWDYAAKSQAEGSTEWRVEMWKAMLTGNKYIENKWLGDGFGFTRYQLQIMAANARTGNNADQQENLMISGGVHNGPISTIRFVGYVGLALFLVLLFLVSYRAALLIRRSEGTPFYTMTLLWSVPSFLQPIAFIFIFGAYEGDLPNLIFSIGMQKMIENSLNAYEAKQKEEGDTVQTLPKFERPPEYVPAAHIA
jgi:hypothetical protein